MKKNKVDVVVIGAGSGGLNVASFFARIKMDVILVDKKEETIGGDCLNTGCVPSKALIHVASLVKTTRDISPYGVSSVGEIEIKKVMEDIRRKQSIFREHESGHYLSAKGIDVRLGEVKFTSPSTVSINGEEITFKKCVIATGSRARKLGTAYDNSVKIFSNETIFNIDFLPKHFVFLGGGPIGCELGQAFARLGSQVTILNQQERVLPREDIEVSAVVSESFEKDGITIINNASIIGIEGGQLSYTLKDSEEIYVCPVDALFVGIGRVLNIEELDLEKADIALDEKKVKLVVNEYLETTNKNVSVVGDVAGSFMFTHAAEEHAKIVINNMLSPLKKKIGNTMPWVTFTSPQVATFGISESDLLKNNIPYVVERVAFLDEDRAITDDSRVGFVKVFLDKKGVMLGGTMVGEDAGELVQELLLLYTESLSITTLYKKTYPYPTKTRINRKLVAQYMSKKLSERNGTLLRFLFKLKVRLSL